MQLCLYQLPFSSEEAKQSVKREKRKGADGVKTESAIVYSTGPIVKQVKREILSIMQR